MKLELEQLIDALADHGVEGERPWKPPSATGPFDEGFYVLGAGNPALEVCVVPATSRPRRDEVRDLWRLRQARQATPLLLVAPFAVDGGIDTHICGPTETDLAVHEIGFQQAVGLAAGALSEPSGLAAVRYLHENTPKVGQDFQGLLNQGMFAAHTLRTRVRKMPEWADALARGEQVRNSAGRELVRELGFTIEQSNTPVHVLRAQTGQARAVAIFLERNESPDTEGGRFGDTSALSQAFTRAERDNIPFVVFTRGAEIRLYAVTGFEGVGRKGQAETYVQANLSLLADDEVGFVPLIFSAEALTDGGTFERILNWSRDFSADLSSRLRDRVYKDVVPALAVAVAEEHARHDRDVHRSLDEIYEETLVILFRLLFLAYAEDRGLLPHATSAEYRRNSLKSIGRALADRANEGGDWRGVQTHALWGSVTQLFETVDQGNRAWSVPAYNGGLFSAEPGSSGAAIDALRLTDEYFAPPLAALLTERGDGGVVGPVDFRSLSVRDFGTIYEGLLESSLSVATTNLTVDSRENFVPAKDGQDIVVPEGSIYFHNRSGARKATGSYFTKDFAVEHLLKHALDPALECHIDRLAAAVLEGRADEAASAFFDFRTADIAMGSGHFLVAAVDHVERRLARFLDEHSLPAVEAELDRMRAAAQDHLGDASVSYEIERRQLLRRQVARRCLYGVDRNPLAVELARLSIWVHTFVPGLPLSFLDHNLAVGDSLSGIGSIDDALSALTGGASGGTGVGQVSLFEGLITGWLDEAKQPLLRLARASDATTTELKAVRDAQDEAIRRAEPVRRLFDLACAFRRGEATPFSSHVDTDAVLRHPDLQAAENASREFGMLHFPAAFPEVFLRANPGFDCLVGNPPWDEATVEEPAFWALRFPGLLGMKPADRADAIARYRASHPDIETEYHDAVERAERMRRALVTGPYAGMGTGDPDLYKAFAWRFWQMARDHGRIGIVLPRSSLTALGSAPWRTEIISRGTVHGATVLKNTGRWVFDDVGDQYTVALLSLEKSPGEEVTLYGPFSSPRAYEAGQSRDGLRFARGEFESWTDSRLFPSIPDLAAGSIFAKMRSHPRLDSPARAWQARPVTEFHATADKRNMVLDPSDSVALWPVFKGASFNLWTPDTGSYYAWCDPDHVVEVLYAKRFRQRRMTSSAFSALPIEHVEQKSTLECLHPRIAFRDIARATDPRTIITALVPPRVTLTNKAPYLLFTRGDRRDEAYLLGVLSSMPLDWMCRRFVELGLNFHIFNALPIPELPRDDDLRRQIETTAGRLAAADDRFAHWADAVGVEVATVDETKREELVAELDALTATAYGLTAEELEHLYETFDDARPANPSRVSLALTAMQATAS